MDGPERGRDLRFRHRRGPRARSASILRGASP